MQREGVRDGGIALRQEGGEPGPARSNMFARRAAIVTVHEAVLVAGLAAATAATSFGRWRAVARGAAAFFLKCNPRLDFRTHSNLRNLEGPSPPHAPSLSDRSVGKDGGGEHGDMWKPDFGVKTRKQHAKSAKAAGG